MYICIFSTQIFIHSIYKTTALCLTEQCHRIFFFFYLLTFTFRILHPEDNVSCYQTSIQNNFVCLIILVYMTLPSLRSGQKDF